MTPEIKAMLIAGFRPPWQDKEVLALCLVSHVETIENWVAQGIIPPPRKRGGKLMWKWSEVDEWLTVGKSGGTPEDPAERIRNATRTEAARSPRH